MYVQTAVLARCHVTHVHGCVCEHGCSHVRLIFVYEKTDDHNLKTGRLHIQHTIFESHRTAGFQTTTGLRKIIENSGNVDDIVAFFDERLLPAEEIEKREIAQQVLTNPPEIGYLTISNALQWRL